MIRLILIELALILLPFIGYGLWQWFTKGHAPFGRNAWADSPIQWLLLGGLGLAVVTLALFLFTTGPEGRYEVPTEPRQGPPDYQPPEDPDPDSESGSDTSL